MDSLTAPSRLHSAEIPDLLVTLGASESGAVRLDLAPLGFATPSGVVWLLCALRALVRGGATVEVLPPPDTKPLHYWLKWMGFYAELEAAGIRCEVPAPPNPLPTTAERALLSQSLLPITRIESARDVASVARDAVGRVGDILGQRMGYGRRDVAAIALVLSEACNNIWEHAGKDAVGFVAAQLFTPRRGSGGRPYLLVGVGDDGCGLRASLARAHPEMGDGTDAAAARAALTEGVSGVPDEERGLGLSTIVSEIGRYRGTLHLRSGAGHLRLKSRGDGKVEETAYPSPASLLGTQLCLTFQALDAR